MITIAISSAVILGGGLALNMKRTSLLSGLVLTIDLAWMYLP